MQDGKAQYLYSLYDYTFNIHVAVKKCTSKPSGKVYTILKIMRKKFLGMKPIKLFIEQQNICERKEIKLRLNSKDTISFVR